jgi:hypothetical protein
MDLKLIGKVALITGSSRGIGLATAKAFTAESCRLMLSARSAGDTDLISRRLQIRIVDDGKHRDLVHVQRAGWIKWVSTDLRKQEVRGRDRQGGNVREKLGPVAERYADSRAMLQDRVTALRTANSRPGNRSAAIVRRNRTSALATSRRVACKRRSSRFRARLNKVPMYFSNMASVASVARASRLAAWTIRIAVRRVGSRSAMCGTHATGPAISCTRRGGQPDRVLS